MPNTVQSHASACLTGFHRSHVAALQLISVVMSGYASRSNGCMPGLDTNGRDLPNKKRLSPPASGHCQIVSGGQELIY